MRRLLPILPPAFLLPLLLAACGPGDRSAGVVSETTNGLAGTVVDGEGKAAAARVAWRPADFLPGEGSAARADTGSIETDGDGRFLLEGLPPGEYRLEARGTGGSDGVAALRHAVVSGARDTLEPLALAEPGEIVVRLAGGEAGEVLVRAYGTGLEVTAQAGDTAVLPGLPAGEYTLRVTARDAGMARDIAVPVASGALTAVGVDASQGTFHVLRPSAFALDSARAHAFLAESGALKTAAFDSVVRRQGDEITALILSGVPLDSLPASVGALRFLDTLWINFCGLKTLPPALFTLDSLRSLTLAYNSDLVVPAGLAGLVSLEHVDLSGLPLGKVPASLPGLPSLQDVRLADNGLDSVPAALLANPRLRHLWLSGNTLASLPDVFTSAHALEKLRLDRNRLTTLPASLRLLGGLKVLHLGGNRLCDLPAETGAFIDALPEMDDWKGSQTGC